MSPANTTAEHPKRVIFTKLLLEKILTGKSKVTYRRTRMNGYYYIAAEEEVADV